MILKLEEIHTYYGLVHMLHGVSLALAEGEVVALLGRNGAGQRRLHRRRPGLPVAGRMLGHASAAMTLDRYGHLFGDELDAVADRMDAARADWD